MANEVKVIVDHFVEVIGTDLQTYTDLNMLWYTGNGRNMPSDTNVREHRFWEYMQRVAAGTSVPFQAAKAARWDDMVRHQVFNNMFWQ